jgi:hypothetical protein
LEEAITVNEGIHVGEVPLDSKDLEEGVSSLMREFPRRICIFNRIQTNEQQKIYLRRCQKTLADLCWETMNFKRFSYAELSSVEFRVSEKELEQALENITKPINVSTTTFFRHFWGSYYKKIEF